MTVHILSRAEDEAPREVFDGSENPKKFVAHLGNESPAYSLSHAENEVSPEETKRISKDFGLREGFDEGENPDESVTNPANELPALLSLAEDEVPPEASNPTDEDFGLHEVFDGSENPKKYVAHLLNESPSYLLSLSEDEESPKPAIPINEGFGLREDFDDEENPKKSVAGAKAHLLSHTKAEASTLINEDVGHSFFHPKVEVSAKAKVTMLSTTNKEGNVMPMKDHLERAGRYPDSSDFSATLKGSTKQDQSILSNVSNVGGTPKSSTITSDVSTFSEKEIKSSASNLFDSSLKKTPLPDIGILPDKKGIVKRRLTVETCTEGYVDCVDGMVGSATCETTCGGGCCAGYEACFGFTGRVCKDGSCKGYYTCYGANIGSIIKSCTGDYACAGAGGGMPEGSISTISDSCNARNACFFAAMDGGSIGAITSSCNAKEGCYYAASNGGNIGAIISSCNTERACYKAADDSGNIGAITPTMSPTSSPSKNPTR